MIHIKKGKPSQSIVNQINEIKRSSEWREISNENTKAIRKQFDLLPKEEIRESLLKEQHYLCAYCMKRIENDGLHTTIEHWRPLSKDKENALEYSNMLGVCDGGRKTDVSDGTHRILCCDAYKGDETEMTLNPMNQQQMELVKYRKNGEIYTDPENSKLEEDINYTLRLNGALDKNGKLIADTSTQLLKGRRDAYNQCQAFFTRLNKVGKCNSNMVKKRIDDIESQEKLPEFAGVTLFFLKKKHRELLRRGM